jgi:(p)ppGpp synthase/HD superfamily hydrolase
MRQAYLDLQKKHQEELSNFPIAYAFSDQQLVEALQKLGAKSKEECVTVFGHGDIVKKENAKPFLDMLKRHTKETQEAMKDKEFAEAAFRYEMDNHEYAINWSGDEDVLACFGMDFDDLRELGLMDAYRRARNAHMKYMEELEII